MSFTKKLLLIVRKVGILLLIVGLTSSTLEYLIMNQIQAEISSMDGTTPWLWVFGALSLILSLVTPVLTILLVLSALVSPAAPLAFLGRHFQQTLKEQTRVMGKVLSWSLLFIIPGFIKFLQLTFVPFVVAIDSKYQQGECDALKLSSQIFKSQWFAVTAWSFLFGLLIPLLLTVFDEYKVLLDTPIPATLLEALETLLGACFVLILYRIWEKSYAADVQLERN